MEWVGMGCMSFIRATQERKYAGEGAGLYVYGDGTHICPFRITPAEWIEVTCRMIEQEASEQKANEVAEILKARLQYNE